MQRQPRLLPLVPTADTEGRAAEMQHHGNADRGNTKDDDNFVYNDTEGEEKDKSEQEYKIHQSQLEDPHIHESKLSFPLIYLTMLIFTSIS